MFRHIFAIGVLALLVASLAFIVVSVRSCASSQAIVISKIRGNDDSNVASIVVEEDGNRFLVACSVAAWESMAEGDSIDLVTIELPNGMLARRLPQDVGADFTFKSPER